MLPTTKVAIMAANSAGDLLKKLVQKKCRESVKTPALLSDIVTEADFLSEKLIKKIVHHYYPESHILSEETNPDFDYKKSKHLWIVDPLDGTISFASGLPFYSVSIAYCVKQKLVSSALYLALTEEVLWAETGKGAYAGKRRLRCKDRPWEKCVIALDPGNRKRKIAMLKLAPAVSRDIRFLQITSGEAGNLGLVAKGNLQGVIGTTSVVWDYAAGIHLALEAGAKVTDFQGKPYNLFSGAGHVVAPPKVLPHIIKSTKKVAKYFT